MSIITEMFYQDDKALIEHMRRHDSAEMRKAILTDDKVRLLYCYYVCARRSVYWKIKSNEAKRSFMFLPIRRWIKYGWGERRITNTWDDDCNTYAKCVTDEEKRVVVVLD